MPDRIEPGTPVRATTLKVSGEAKKEKQAKVAFAADLWTPAINKWGGRGRWAFLAVTHMENAADLMRAKFLGPRP